MEKRKKKEKVIDIISDVWKKWVMNREMGVKKR